MITSIVAPLLISIYGDSTILGVEVIKGQGKITENSAPVVLQRLYGDRAIVDSKARIGATFKDLILGDGMFTKPFSESIKTDPGKIIIANFAINDAHIYDMSQYKVYMQEFINIVRSNGKTPVLEEPNPICADKKWQLNLIAYMMAMNEVATKNHILIIPEYQYIVSNVPKWRMMEGDCIHPNDNLYAIKAQVEYSILESAHGK